MLDGELPKPKPKPSMHHIQMGAGWKKRLGKGGAGMHFVSVETAMGTADCAWRWMHTAGGIRNCLG